MGTSPEVAEAMPLKETPEKMALEKNDEEDADNNKGGLNSDSFLLSKSPKNRCQIGLVSSIHWREDTQDSDLTPFFGDFKGHLNSEWIYEFIVCPKIPTKNYRDFWPRSLLEGSTDYGRPERK